MDEGERRLPRVVGGGRKCSSSWPAIDGGGQR